MKYLKLALGLLLLIVVFTELALYLLNFDTRHRAESLIAELRPLKVGVSTLQDAKPLLTKYKAKEMPGTNCSPTGIGYSIVVYNRVNFLGMRHLWLLNAGIRPIWFTATLTFSGFRLCDLIYSTGAWMAGGQFPSKDSALKSLDAVELRAETRVEQVDPRVPNYYEFAYTNALLRTTPWDGQSLKMLVTVSSNAPSIEFQHALGFDLSCFTSLRGCRTFCQMMPLASRDALEKHKTEGLNIPEDEVKYPGCSRQLTREAE